MSSETDIRKKEYGKVQNFKKLKKQIVKIQQVKASVVLRRSEIVTTKEN